MSCQTLRSDLKGVITHPRSIRLNLQPLQGNLPHDLDVLLRLHAAPIHPDVQAQVHHAPHLLHRPSETVHQPLARQLLEPRLQQPLEVLARGARVQEQRQLQLHGQVQLRFEVPQLLLLGRQEEPVVVEADLAEGDGVARGRGGGREVFERGEERGGPAGEGVKLLG